MISSSNISTQPGRSEYLATSSTDTATINGFRKDASWVRASFIAPTMTNKAETKLAMDETDILNMSFSPAHFDFSDSKPGGSQAINPVPAFTRFADVRVRGTMPKAREFSSISHDPSPIGSGRFHFEAFTNNMQVIHIRFGVPSYNSLTQFFTGFYNSSASSLARTGRYELSWTEKFLKFAAGAISLVLMPLAIIPALFIFAGEAVRFLLRIPSSKFYYLKPSMPAYWQAVANMYNQMAVNMGLVKYTQEKITEDFLETGYQFSQEQFSIFHQIFPNFTDKGVLDVCAVAGRYKRLEIAHRKSVMSMLNAKDTAGWYGKVRKVYDEASGLQQTNAMENLPAVNKAPLDRLWDSWNMAEKMSRFGIGTKEDSMVEMDMRKAPDLTNYASVAEAERALKSPYKAVEDDSIWRYFLAEADAGSDYASFRVNYTGTSSFSMNNSTSPSPMAQKLNAGSASARDLKIDLAGGNIDSFGISKAVLDGVGSVMSTVADTLQISGLAAFAGNAFVDIPDHWENHTANAPSMSYTIDLVSPYGNKVSQMLNIYLQVCMLVCGCGPLATGKQSYQSPFLCEIYDRGRCISRLAIIESLQIERGIGHTGWNNEGGAMGVRVNVTFKDLSSVVSIPIQNGVSLFPLEGIFDGESKFSDMLMAWSGLPLREVTDRMPILKRQIDMKVANYSTYFSASRLMQDLGASPLGQLASIFMSGTPKR